MPKSEPTQQTETTWCWRALLVDHGEHYEAADVTAGQAEDALEAAFDTLDVHPLDENSVEGFAWENGASWHARVVCPHGQARLYFSAIRLPSREERAEVGLDDASHGCGAWSTRTWVQAQKFPPQSGTCAISGTRAGTRWVLGSGSSLGLRF